MKKCLLLILLPIALWAADPQAVYLTWRCAPDTTMHVQWITDQAEHNNRVEYRKEGKEKWEKVTGSCVSLPTAPKYTVHYAELCALEPATTYEFRVGEHAASYTFHTMPSQATRPIRFVTGGDMYHDSLDVLKKTNKEAAKTNPDFALVGGDIAYAANKYRNYPENTERWIEWITAWHETMRTPEGHLIPILAALGNHDVNGRYGQTPAQAASFYTLFAAMPGPQGYQVLDFGNYLSIVILDSGHTHPIEGKQTEWLKETLEKRQQIPHIFALYHVPAYPSVRKMTTKMSPNIRKHWVPLFEKYNLSAAFEHHDHSYKRTHLIQEGKVVEKGGVLYLGDGGWGADKPRLPKDPKRTWFLAQAIAARHFILVTLDKGKPCFTAIDSDGAVIDHFILDSMGSQRPPV